MNENIKKISEHLLSQGMSLEEIEDSSLSSVGLAFMLASYAHKDQRRENGESYLNHPLRVLENYRNLVGIIPEDPFCIDKETLEKYGLPYLGVQEVCLLHDVIEDTEFSLMDVKDIYVNQGFKDYFELYMEDALRRITHDKRQGYPEYIAICLGNPVSSLVKMMDLQDNLRVIDLVSLDDKKEDRASNYLHWIKVINDRWGFLEGVSAYKEEMRKQPKKNLEDVVKDNPEVSLEKASGLSEFVSLRRMILSMMEYMHLIKENEECFDEDKIAWTEFLLRDSLPEGLKKATCEAFRDTFKDEYSRILTNTLKGIWESMERLEGR